MEINRKSVTRPHLVFGFDAGTLAVAGLGLGSASADGGKPLLRFRLGLDFDLDFAIVFFSFC